MAYNRDITADDQVFYDTDRVIRFAIYQGNPTAAEILAGTAVPEDVSAWTFSWTLRKRTSSGSALISKLSTGSPAGITVTGTYNADPATNTQRVEVTIDDTDTYDPAASPVVQVKPGEYVHALKRTDAGYETVLSYGTFTLLQAAAWESA